ncbi:hypothetical protein [Virgibacillus subterraneus]|uniref:hypothetical protein n=1 Tax=Virgibacillus subterraneus TaxID=621109 RepID=UPI00111415F9|nr:hypothetical protein [Virgibacillus subterraneus]
MHGDSCGRKGIGETPQCAARGGSTAARGKRSVFPEWSHSSKIFFNIVSQSILTTKIRKQ